VADNDDTVTIRHKTTGEERTVARDAVPFFPDWELLDKAGRRAANQPTAPKE
jgi:hypothetical protein